MTVQERIKLTHLPGHLSSEIYTLVCSASYESRCLSIPNQIADDRVQRVILCENEDLEGKGKRNGDLLRNRFGEKAKTVPLSKANPLKGADNLVREFRSSAVRQTRHFLVDITTFTHEGLLILLRVMYEFLSEESKVCIAYNVATEYSVGLSDTDKWLSRGLKQIRSVLGFSGTFKPSRRTHLIVLVGFEADRAARLIEAYEPAALSLGVGDNETVRDKHLAVNRAFHTNLSEAVSDYRPFCFSCDDAIVTKERILEQIKLFPGHNVVVAPMNTKISTVGAALAAFEAPDIQLCYAQANLYNFENYSTPGDECILFEMPGISKSNN